MIIVRRLGLAALLALYQGVVALVVTWPIEAAVRAAYGQNLQGDAPLWREGALELLDLLLHGRAAWSPVVTGLAVSLAFGAILGVVPVALVLRSLGDLDRGTWKPLVARLARSVASWGTLLLLWLAYLVLAAIVVVVARFAAHLVAAIASGSGEVRAQQIGWCVGGAFVLLFLPLNVLHDLAQASAVLDGRGFFRSIGRAARNFVGPEGRTRRSVGLTYGWIWRALVGLAFVAVGGSIASRLGGQGGFALVQLFVAHQIVIVVRAWLRVDWLARAVDATEPSVHLSIEEAIAEAGDAAVEAAIEAD